MMTPKGWRILMHGIFWAGYLFILVNLSQVFLRFSEALLRSSLIVAVHAVFFYANTLWITPRFFERRRYLPFFLLILAFITGISLLRFLFIERLFTRPESIASLVEKSPVLKMLFLSFSTVIIAILSSVYAISEKRWSLQRANTEAELKLLKAQINPHFLFNALNNIYALALEKSDNAAPMVLKLAEMMRYAYHDCEAEKVLLEKEVVYIRNFIGLYQLRFEKARSIHLEVQVAEDAVFIAPLLFNPLLENMIKYSDLDYNDNGFMQIYLRVSKTGTMEFKLSNSYDPHNRPSNTGLGLSNLKRRLELYYPGRHIFSTTDNNSVYSIYLHLQLA